MSAEFSDSWQNLRNIVTLYNRLLSASASCSVFWKIESHTCRELRCVMADS